MFRDINWYDIYFIEIGLDENHIHFLVQNARMYSPKKIVKTFKSILARDVFRLHPEVKEQLWGSQYVNEELIRNYLKSQGNKKNTSRFIRIN